MNSDCASIVQKLNRCRVSLKGWSRRTFGNNKERIQSLRNSLGWVQQQPYSELICKEEKALKEDLEMAMPREEMYLHQRSRLNWISYGDRNTAFFHATMIQRRQRNQLSKLRVEGGSWVSSDREINEQLHDYFSSLFQATGPRNFDLILGQVEASVSQSMNISLTRPFSDEEIK